MFVSLICASALNIFIDLPFLNTIIAAGVGIFGAVMLVYATSDVLNNPEYDNPVQRGADAVCGAVQHLRERPAPAHCGCSAAVDADPIFGLAS